MLADSKVLSVTPLRAAIIILYQRRQPRRTYGPQIPTADTLGSQNQVWYLRNESRLRSGLTS